MSIVRVGLGETKNFAEGYEAIFGKKESKQATPSGAKSDDRAAAAAQPAGETKKKKK